MGAPKGNKYALGLHEGRPSKFNPTYTAKVFEYIDWCHANPVIVESKKTTVGKEVSETVDRQELTRLPSQAGFSRWAGFPRSSIYQWVEAHKDFKAAIEELDKEQESQLIELGRAGEGNSRFAQFMLSAKHDYKEKSEVEVDIPNLKVDF